MSQLKLEKKVYPRWAFSENSGEKGNINKTIYEELKKVSNCRKCIKEYRQRGTLLYAVPEAAYRSADILYSSTEQD